jgi:hypothetical protein
MLFGVWGKGSANGYPSLRASVVRYSVLSTQYIVLLALACCGSVSAADAPQSDAITPKDGVIKLFDGKTLGDTYTWLKDTKREDPRKVFTVSDGFIHISGDGYGCITTNKRYRDYHMVVEYKFGERTWHGR